MIKVKDNIATREPIPAFLVGLARESLADLSWTDPALGVSDCAWWPEIDQSPPLNPYERYGDETLTVDADRKVVISTRSVEPWSAEEIAEREAAELKAQTPEKISDRQFFTALWKDGERITYEEALAAVTIGAIPAEMEGFLSMLEVVDAEGAREARLLLSGATEFYRDNYLIPVFGSMYGMSEVQIDALWRLGATL